MTSHLISFESYKRATTYPYRIPNRSFVYFKGKDYALSDNDPMPDLAGRTPVLAVGSNQSPEQLALKFDDIRQSTIPVIRTELQNFDSVYSPHIASYGAIPATLQHAPGARVMLSITWLDPQQLTRMHNTEISNGDYGYGRIEGVKLRCELGPNLTSVNVYYSKHGVLCRNFEPIPLTELAAKRRLWHAMNQLELQHYIQKRLAPNQDYSSFIQSSIKSKAMRIARSKVLQDKDKAPAYPGFIEIFV